MNMIRISFAIITSLTLLLLVACTDRTEASKVLVKEGKRLQSMGMNQAAMEKFEAAAAKDKENFEAWYLCGTSKISVGNHRDAIEDLDRSIALKEDYAPAWFAKGMAWFYLDNQEKACENWKKAEALGHPNIDDRTRHCR